MPEAKGRKVWLYSVRKADSSTATRSTCWRIFSSKRWKQVRLGEAHDDAEIQLKAEGCTVFDGLCVLGPISVAVPGPARVETADDDDDDTSSVSTS